MREDDELIATVVTDGGSKAVLATRAGKAIHFTETDVRIMGRTAQGVKGIELKSGDEVVSMAAVEEGGNAPHRHRKGYGKRTRIEEYRLQGRGGKGIANIKIAARNGQVVAVPFVNDDDEVMVITAHGMIVRLGVKDVNPTGRATVGRPPHPDRRGRQGRGRRQARRTGLSGTVAVEGPV